MIVSVPTQTGSTGKDPEFRAKPKQRSIAWCATSWLCGTQPRRRQLLRYLEELREDLDSRTMAGFGDTLRGRNASYLALPAYGSHLGY